MNYEEDFLRLPPGVGQRDRDQEVKLRLKRMKAKRWMDDNGVEYLLKKKVERKQ